MKSLVGLLSFSPASLSSSHVVFFCQECGFCWANYASFWILVQLSSLFSGRMRIFVRPSSFSVGLEGLSGVSLFAFSALFGSGSYFADDLPSPFLFSLWKESLDLFSVLFPSLFYRVQNLSVLISTLPQPPFPTYRPLLIRIYFFLFLFSLVFFF